MNQTDKGDRAVGTIIASCTAVGWLAVIGAGVAAAQEAWTGAGVLMVAAALSFGLLANASLRR